MPTPENQQRLAQLQLAATLARVGGWRLDVSDNSMAWSDQLSAIYQIPQGSAPTLEHAVAFALPPWRPQVRALFDACARDGTPFDLEFQVAAGGRAYWTRIIGEAERDAAGAVVAVHGVLQDITAKYESDQLSFQRRFRELADAMPQVVWTADARGNVDFANSAWRTLTGVQKAELDSASWLEALHPDDVAMTLRAWEACVASGAPLQTEYRVRCLADGLYRWQLVQAQAIRDDDGVILRWYGSVTDIHDRKIDEEKMQSLANRLSMTLESITDALFTVDRYWRFSYVNYESERVLQRPRRELLGQEIWDAFPLFRGSRFESACREALEQLSTQSVEELYSPLGIWLEIRIYPFEDGLAVYYRDVTGRKDAEARRLHESRVQAGIVAAQREIAAAAELSLQDMMDLMAQRAETLLAAAGAIVGLVEGDEVVFRACSGMVAPHVGWRMPMQGSLAGEAVQRQATLTSTDNLADGRTHHSASNRMGVRSMITAPLRAGNRIIGVLQAVYDRPGGYTDTDVTNLEILVESLGTVFERRRMTEQLLASEEQYRLLFDHNPFPVLVYERDTLAILAVNAAAVRHYGHSEAAFLGMTLREIHPAEDVTMLEQSAANAALRQGDNLVVARHRKKDGEIIDVELSARDIVFNGKQAGMAQINDVTSRLRAERDLLRVSRAQRMLSACNEAMVREQDEPRLLEEVCRITVEIGGYRLAWVGFAEHDSARRIVPVASYGANDGLLENTALSWRDDVVAGRGPSGRTVRSGQASISSDLRDEKEEFGPGLDLVLARGLRSAVCLPLSEGGATFGILNLYAAEVTTFGHDEIALLQSLANDLAFGIAKLRVQHEQQRMHAAMLNVAAGVSGARGASFFAQLARNMAQALGASAAVIARFNGTPEAPVAHILAAVVDGDDIAGFSYRLEGAPCAHLLEVDEYVLDGDLAEHWDVPPALAPARGRSYVGRRLLNVAGQPLGLLYVLFHDCIGQREFVTSALRIFAARAASELEQQESDLRIREQASLLDKAQDAIVVRGMDNRILYWNKGAERLYGWTTGEALGQSFIELVAADTETSARATAKVLSLGEWTGEVTQRRRDGSTFSVEGRWTLIADDEGEPRSIFEINTDITERKLAEEQIRQLAFYDALTNLPNRTLLMDRLQEALNTTSRSHATGALLFIDLDNFKALNDTLGHDVGDMLLCEVTRRLVSCVRESDTVARLGGDEFVLLLDALAPSSQEAAIAVKAIGEKIIAALNLPYELAGFEHHSTASIGITLFSGHQSSVGDLLKRADLAMYQAKAAGRNTLRFFDPEMQKLISARVDLENELRLGLQHQQFVLYYQPQVDADAHVLGAEVLIRWQHPQRGMVPPFEFIPVAEECGLILPIGHWVLATACAQLVEWAKSPATAHLVLAVNVSARQFRQADFVDQVLGLLAETGADPTRLKLELTESLLVDNMDETIDRMSSLKECGVGFSLDDFGTGYSSLAYLKRLPLDQLKIDQSFVRDVLHDPNDAAIARTVVALAQSLGLNVIAEGVETQEQRDFLHANGCNTYQGYLFSRPVPVDDFEQLLGLGLEV
jgi:diguanylate cyclase (GGDEF)-like protein/PAS domain S-box-containing protein